MNFPAYNFPFLQVLYTIGPSADRTRREAPLHTVLSQVRSPRSPTDDTRLERLKEDLPEYESSFTTNNLSQETTMDNISSETYDLSQNLPHLWTEEKDYSWISSQQRGESMSQVNSGINISSNPEESLPVPSFLTSLNTRNGTNMRGFLLTTAKTSTSESSVFFSVLYVVIALTVLLGIIIIVLLVSKKYFRRAEKEKVIVVRSLKNEREEFRRKESGDGKVMDRPKTLPANMTLNSESNLQTVKVKTLAITVRNNLEHEGTEV